MQKLLSAAELAPIHLLANTDLRLILNILCEGGKVEKRDSSSLFTIQRG